MEEKEGQDGGVDGESEGERRVEEGGDEVGFFGEEGLEEFTDGGIEEEDAEAAAKAELEGKVGGDEGIEEEFDEESAAEEIDGTGGLFEEFGEEEENRDDPSALDSG